MEEALGAFLFQKGMKSRSRRRQAIRLPPELKGLCVRILETGQLDLGVSRETLLRFLERLRAQEERFQPLQGPDPSTQDSERSNPLA